MMITFAQSQAKRKFNISLNFDIVHILKFSSSKKQQWWFRQEFYSSAQVYAFWMTQNFATCRMINGNQHWSRPDYWGKSAIRLHNQM